MAVEDYKLPRIGRHGVVTLPAEVDVTNADEIREALLTAASHVVAVLIIDMSGTTFCDSAGVGAIIAAYRQAAATGDQAAGSSPPQCFPYSHSSAPTS